MLLASESNNHALCLGKPLIRRQRNGVIRLTLRIEHLEQQEIALGTTAKTAHAGNRSNLLDDSVALGNDLGPVGFHDGEARRADGGVGEGAGRAGDVVRRLEAVEQRGNGRGGKGHAETDAGHAKGLGEGLHHDQVGVLGHQLGEGGVFGRKVDVGLVKHDDAVPRRVVEQRHDIGLVQQRAGGIARRAEIGNLDGRVGRERGRDGGHVEAKRGRGQQRHFDNGNVVDLRRDGVHAVCRGACQDAVLAGDAEAAQQGVDGLVAADTDEEVGRRERLFGVGVGVA